MRRLAVSAWLWLASAAPPAAVPPTRFDGVPRAAFNARAAALALPLFWIDDADRDGALDPGELAVTWGPIDVPREHYVRDGRLTPAFAAAYARIAAPAVPPLVGAGERARRAAVLAELAQGRPTLLLTRLQNRRDTDLVRHLLAAARLVERLHARQTGVLGLDAGIPAGDDASRALFFRNQAPTCKAPATERDPSCRALEPLPALRSGLYPASLQERPDFCRALEGRVDAEALLDPFTVVRHRPGARGAGDAATDELVSVPYHVAFADDLRPVSEALRAAASVLEGDPGETALRAYLMAAARAFVDGTWFEADAAWKAMGATNSRWYVRVAPDEVFADPCGRKAGFHLSLARIDPASIAWQRRLEPVKAEMEAAVAALAGPPYRARPVGFSLPDFIHVVLEAGDGRAPLGGTIGQSLPNWGPVADSGGRTVAMTNLYSDPDSQAVLVEQARSLLCRNTAARLDPSPDLVTLSTVLHEVTHGLGPVHDHRVDGKIAAQVFGGPLAATLEELKAQTGALYLADWLAARGLLPPAEAADAHLLDVLWAFAQIAEGMSDARGQPKAYPQLAAIQMGFLAEQGVLTWRAGERAANGADAGCFDVDPGRWPEALEGLARLSFGIKARGDRLRANEAVERWTGDGTAWARLRTTIAERWRRAPQPSFVYAIESFEEPLP